MARARMKFPPLSVRLSGLCDDPPFISDGERVRKRTCRVPVKLIAQVRDYLDSLVHASARGEPLTAARHRAFLAPRLIGGLAALTALPLHLALRGTPGTIEIAIYVWLAAPVITAWYLSRTGRYEQAYIISSCALAALIATIAMATGGIVSFAAVWLVVVPLEAALSASRRV